MAEVWAAQVEGPEGFVKSVALKFVVDSGDPEMDRLFVNEARVAARLQHPNLVTVFDFDRIVDATDFGSPGRYYIAMERVEGHDLRRVLEAGRESGRRLSPALALYVAAEVLQGLRYLHERPGSGSRRGPALIHRDVSPHNVLVAYSGDVKLSDFGIAKTVAPLAATTQPGLVRGKLSYAAPEQIRSGPIDPRADQFSLGVMLWEMLAGARLFGGGSDAEIVVRVTSGDIPPFPRHAGIDATIEAVVRRMLANDRERRFATTAAALAAVVALPGYVADGVALGAWMGAVFSPRDPALPSTQELPSPGLGAAPLAGATRMLRERVAAPPAVAVGALTGLRKKPTGRAGVRPRPRSKPRAARSRRSAISSPAGALAAVERARLALLRWGLVAMGVAVLAWGAAMALRLRGARHDDTLASRALLGRHRSDIDTAPLSARTPIVIEPVRSGYSEPTPRPPEDDSGASDASPGQALSANPSLTPANRPGGPTGASTTARKERSNGAPIIE
jgi:hypothetical protein